jgi:dTMP kinase
MDKRGKLILIEGGDGAGKDTHVERLHGFLKDQDTVYTREPGGTRLGKTLREMLLHGSHGEISLPAELFLFMADRAQNMEETIKPALAAGKIVVSNRSWISFIVYQIYGREQYEWEDFLQKGINKLYEGVLIDLAIVLDVSPEAGRERQKAMGKIPDTMESMIDAAHGRIRQAYLDIAKTVPTAVVIDASRPVEDVWTDVKKAVTSIL